MKGRPILKTPKEIEILRKANAIVMEILYRIKEEVRPGKSTYEFEEMALSLCEKRELNQRLRGIGDIPMPFAYLLMKKLCMGCLAKIKF